MKADPDTQLMSQFRNGDEDAFRVLFQRNKNKIVNYCYRFCADMDIAEELAQEIFLRVYKAASRYKPNARFSTWIFRIATNVCLNELRRLRYNYSYESLNSSQNPNEERSPKDIEDRSRNDPQDLLIDQEQEQRIQEAILTLPGKQRTAILLRVYYGFSYNEIGFQMKCSQSSVKSLIHRGRQTLKQALKECF